jgi:hypothetical protein
MTFPTFLATNGITLATAITPDSSNLPGTYNSVLVRPDLAQHPVQTVDGSGDIIHETTLMGHPAQSPEATLADYAALFVAENIKGLRIGDRLIIFPIFQD